MYYEHNFMFFSIAFSIFCVVCFYKHHHLSLLQFQPTPPHPWYGFGSWIFQLLNRAKFCYGNICYMYYIILYYIIQLYFFLHGPEYNLYISLLYCTYIPFSSVTQSIVDTNFRHPRHHKLWYIQLHFHSSTLPYFLIPSPSLSPYPFLSRLCIGLFETLKDFIFIVFNFQYIFPIVLILDKSIKIMNYIISQYSFLFSKYSYFLCFHTF